jgi:hypothetical protein
MGLLNPCLFVEHNFYFYICFSPPFWPRLIEGKGEHGHVYWGQKVGVWWLFWGLKLGWIGGCLWQIGCEFKEFWKRGVLGVRFQGCLKGIWGWN